MGSCAHRIVTDPEGESVCTLCGCVSFNFQSSSTNDGDQYSYSTKGFLVATARRNADYTLGGPLSGHINMANVDAHGNSIRDLPMVKRMRKRDRFYANTSYNSDKSVRSAIWIITRLCEKLYLGEDLKERASGLYRRAYGAGAVRGRCTKWIACASLLYATKEHEVPNKSVEDFVRALEETYTTKHTRNYKKHLFTAYKVLTRVLDLPLPPPVSPLSEMTKFATRAGLSGVVVSRATAFYKKIQKVDPTAFCGKNPGAIAASLLYISYKMCNGNGGGGGEGVRKIVGLSFKPYINQQHITASAGISIVTLRKRTEECIRILQDQGERIPASLYYLKRPSSINIKPENLPTIVSIPSEYQLSIAAIDNDNQPPMEEMILQSSAPMLAD